MNVKYRIVFSMAIAILAATASLAEVKTDYDRTAEFSRYKTYSWGKIHSQDPLWVDRIKAAVASALAAKGWTEMESGGDVSIMAMEMTEDHRTLNTYYDNFGGGWGWRRWGGSAMASGHQRQLRRRTKWERSSSTCSIPTPRN